MESLGINLVSIIIYSILFGLVYVIVKKFLTAPLMSMLEKRRTEIKEGLDLKNVSQAELKKVEVLKEETLTAAKAEARTAIEKMKKETLEEKKVILEKAKKEAEEILKKANEKLDIEKKKLQEEFKLKLEQRAREIAIDSYKQDKLNIDKNLITQAIKNL